MITKFVVCAVLVVSTLSVSVPRAPATADTIGTTAPDPYTATVNYAFNALYNLANNTELIFDFVATSSKEASKLLKSVENVPLKALDCIYANYNASRGSLEANVLAVEGSSCSEYSDSLEDLVTALGSTNWTAFGENLNLTLGYPRSLKDPLDEVIGDVFNLDFSFNGIVNVLSALHSLNSADVQILSQVQPLWTPLLPPNGSYYNTLDYFMKTYQNAKTALAFGNCTTDMLKLVAESEMHMERFGIIYGVTVAQEVITGLQNTVFPTKVTQDAAIHVLAVKLRSLAVKLIHGWQNDTRIFVDLVNTVKDPNNAIYPFDSGVIRSQIEGN